MWSNVTYDQILLGAVVVELLVIIALVLHIELQ